MTEDVCKVAADLLGLKRSQVLSTTSLADLGADELDLVELIMELEDRFDVSIPDEAVAQAGGSGDWKVSLKRITMNDLGRIVEQQKHDHVRK